jgi:hypothetical protein
VETWKLGFGAHWQMDSTSRHRGPFCLFVRLFVGFVFFFTQSFDALHQQQQQQCPQ